MSQLAITNEAVVVGGQLWQLVDNDIIVSSDELTDYHKREYDWVAHSRYTFPDSITAEKMFRYLKVWFNAGRSDCARDIRDALGV